MWKRLGILTVLLGSWLVFDPGQAQARDYDREHYRHEKRERERARRAWKREQRERERARARWRRHERERYGSAAGYYDSYGRWRPYR